MVLAGAGVLGFLLRTWLFSLSKTQVSRLYYPIFQTLLDVEALAAHCLAMAEQNVKEQRAKVAERRDDDLKHAKHVNAKALSEGESTRDESLRKINEVYARRMVEIQTTQQVELREAIETYEHRKVELRAHRESSARKLDEKYHGLKEKIRTPTRTPATWRPAGARG